MGKSKIFPQIPKKKVEEQEQEPPKPMEEQQPQELPNFVEKTPEKKEEFTKEQQELIERISSLNNNGIYRVEHLTLLQQQNNILVELTKILLDKHEKIEKHLETIAKEISKP